MNIYSGNERVDVVVPIYKGQCYIKGIICQLEACLERMGGTVSVGLILVNDDPEDIFEKDYFSKKIDVLTVDTDRNRGIHGARVRGLSYCLGSYIVFLDQDDRISENYLKSQLTSLGAADAVICRAVNGGREFYDRDRSFEEITSACNMFSEGNGILSPGQVLMRRKAVPRFWQENILQHNGADDWMLWLCMLQEGRYFVQNQDIVYEHILGGGNCSESAFGMYQSEKEMYKILEEHKYLDTEHLMQLRQAIQKGTEVRLKDLDRLKMVVGIYDTWTANDMEGNSVAMALKRAGYYTVAIYGMGKMGMRLYQQIVLEVEVKCFIDRNAAYIKTDIPVYTLEDDIPHVDLVIIALVDKENKILTEISSRLQVPVKNIESILQGALDRS